MLFHFPNPHFHYLPDNHSVVNILIFDLKPFTAILRHFQSLSSINYQLAIRVPKSLINSLINIRFPIAFYSNYILRFQLCNRMAREFGNGFAQFFFLN